MKNNPNQSNKGARNFLNHNGVNLDLVSTAIRNIWKQLLPIKEIPMDGNFMLLGGDSFAVMQMLAMIKELIEVELSIDEFLDDPTYAGVVASVITQLMEKPLPFNDSEPESEPQELSHEKLADFGAKFFNARKREEMIEKFISAQIMPIVDALDGPGGKCLVELQPGLDGPAFFLVHPVGGTVKCYKPLVDHMPAHIPIYGLQSPVLNSPETGYLSVEDTCAIYVDAIQQIQPTGPYRIAGWSGGAYYAFEMGRQLERVGHQVSFVGIIDAEFISSVSVSQISMVKRLKAVIRNCKDLNCAKLFHKLNAFWMVKQANPHLDTDNQNKQISQSMERFNADFRKQKNKFVLASKITGLAIKHYSPGVYTGKVVVLRTAFYKKTQVSNGVWDIQWQRVIKSDVIIEELPGNHATIMYKPGVEKHAQTLSKHLL